MSANSTLEYFADSFERILDGHTRMSFLSHPNLGRAEEKSIVEGKERIKSEGGS
jgi:hypothetical protein